MAKNQGEINYFFLRHPSPSNSLDNLRLIKKQRIIIK